MGQKVSNYIIGNSIGRGSFGSVYYCVHKETGQEYAVKILSKMALRRQTIFCATEDDPEALSNQLEQLYREIRFMKEHPHPLLVGLEEVIDVRGEDSIYVVLEIAEGTLGSVYEDTVVEQPGLAAAALVTQPVQPWTLFRQAHQVAAAVAYLHELGYVHGDLKQANILRMADGRFVLADFGLTQKQTLGCHYRHPVSPAYAAPESAGLTTANDVWGFGVIFCMGLTGHHPAALVASFCTDTGVCCDTPHWGILAQHHFAAFRQYFLHRIDLLADDWALQYQQIQKLFQTTIHQSSTKVLLRALGQLVFQCFAPPESRPSMQSIAAKLNEVYLKYSASRIQRHFAHNHSVQTVLLDIGRHMRLDNVSELMFVLGLSNFKRYKDMYLQAVDVPDISYAGIDFSPFRGLARPQRDHGDASAGESPLCGSLPLLPTRNAGLEEVPPAQGPARHAVPESTPPVAAPRGGPKTAADVLRELRQRGPQGGPASDQAQFRPLVNQSRPRTSAEIIRQLQDKRKTAAEAELDSSSDSFCAGCRLGELSAGGTGPQTVPFRTSSKSDSDSPLPSAVRCSAPPACGQDSAQPASAASVGMAPDIVQQRALVEGPRPPEGHDGPTQHTSTDSAEDAGQVKDSGVCGPDVGQTLLPQAGRGHCAAAGGEGAPPCDGERHHDEKFTANSSIYQQRFPGLKFRKSKVSLLSEFNTGINSPQQDSDPSDGPIYIMSTKPKHMPPIPIAPVPLPKLNLNGTGEPHERNEAQQLQKATPRNLNPLQTTLVQNDDLFEQNEDVKKIREQQKQHHPGGAEPQGTPKSKCSEFRSGEVFNIRQRENFFLKLDQHYNDVRHLFEQQKNINKLFQKIGYAKDPTINFKYNRSEDQNKIIGLGSFDDCETLSTGARESDGMSDFSSDSDELVELSGEDETRVNEILNLNFDDEGGTYNINGLISRGKGNFQTLHEDSAFESSRIDESDTGNRYFLYQVESSGSIVAPKFLSKEPIRCGYPDEEPSNSDQLFTSTRISPQYANKRAPSELGNDFELSLVEQYSRRTSIKHDQDSNSTLSSDDNFMSRPASTTQSRGRQFVVQRPANPSLSANSTYGPSQLSLKLNLAKEPGEKEDKFQLFDDEQNAEFKMTNTDQRLTARLTARGSIFGGVKSLEAPQGPVSARQEVGDGNPEPVDLSARQTVILFHQGIIIYNMLNHFLEEEQPETFNSVEYKQLSENFSSPIRQIQRSQPQVKPLGLEDMLVNFILWRDCVGKYSKNPLVKVANTIIARIEKVIDTQPAFLKPQCGWVIQNSYTLYKEVEQAFVMLNDIPGNEVGLTLSINNNLVLQSPKPQTHDLQIYVGLEKAECTPVVGVRHKSNVRAVAIQACDRCIPFQKSVDELISDLTKTMPIIMQHESYTVCQNKYFAFQFLEAKVPQDYNQYQYKNALYSIIFVSINKQVIMPYLLLDCLVDLVMNSRKYSKPSTIRASIFNSENNFYMIVCDSGCGMSEEKTVPTFSSQEKVMGARSPGVFAREFGNGSGMAKLKMLVGFYGGIVNISSVEHGGTKIIVKVPMVGNLASCSTTDFAK